MKNTKIDLARIEVRSFVTQIAAETHMIKGKGGNKDTRADGDCFSAFPYPCNR